MTQPPPRPRALVCALALALVAACSGKGGETTHTASEFTASDAVLFDDGVDFISGALALEGRWREDWAQELTDRVARADFIAAVKVRTLRTDVSPHGDNTYRVGVSVHDVLYGSVSGEEVTLTTTPQSRGFRTVDTRARNLEAGMFLLFGKWEAYDEGERLHWHLAPDTEDVRAAVNRMLRGRKPAS